MGAKHGRQTLPLGTVGRAVEPMQPNEIKSQPHIVVLSAISRLRCRQSHIHNRDIVLVY